jgi:hypothetical protein
MKQKFSDRMIEQFPDLFPKDEDGKATYPECGFYCPKGWETTVETTLFYLNNRLQYADEVQTWTAWYNIASKLNKWITIPIYNTLYRATNPCEKFHWKDGKRQTFIMLFKGQSEAAAKEAPIKAALHRAVLRLYRFTKVKYRTKPVPIKPIRIDQIKEKFGGLRLYISGGDSKAHSIISFAEILTGNICEETGAPGKKVYKSGWCKTLSPSAAKKLGYT